jgi:hypothetical protein
MKQSQSQADSLRLSQADSEAGFALPSFMLDDERLGTQMFQIDEPLLDASSLGGEVEGGMLGMSISTPAYMVPDAPWATRDTPVSFPILPGDGTAAASSINKYSSNPIPPRWPSFARMNSQDVYYITRTILQGFHTEDPFNDDYYYYASNNKKHSGPNPIMPNLLSLEEENFEKRKEKVLIKAAEVRTKAWETANKVLGHYTKSSLKKPRQLLVIEESSAIVADELKLNNQKWCIRKSIEEGFEAVQQIEDSMNRSVKNTGDREIIQARLERNKEKLGSIIGLSFMEDGSVGIQDDTSLRLIAVTKGKKLLLRAIPLLNSKQRDTLLILALTHLLRFVCSKDYTEENDRVDDMMSVALANSLKSSSSPVKLPVLAKCVIGMITAHTVETFPIVLQHKQSSVVIEALLTMGEVGASKGGEGTEEWRTAFTQLSEMVVASTSATY